MKKTIFCRLKVEGFHNWPDAPVQCAYLRDRHRHIFHILVAVPVADSNREIEFIDFKQFIRRKILAAFGESKAEPVEFGAMSCEHIAEWVLKVAPQATLVEVSEDGENGAIVSRE